MISACEYNVSGSFSGPERVLEEPFHLSYPQVFEHGGECCMVPEMRSSNRLSLYPSRLFSGDWIEEHVLTRNQQLFDTTFFFHNGFFWLTGAERDGGFGDSSDTLAV